MKVLIALIIAFISLCPGIFSQTAFSLQVREGMTMGYFNRIKHRGDYSQYFKLQPALGGGQGIYLKVDFKDRWSLEIGYENLEIGIRAIDNFLKLACDTCLGSESGRYREVGLAFDLVPMRVSYKLPLSERFSFFPLAGLQIGTTNDGYIRLNGSQSGFGLKKVEEKTDWTFALQLGGEFSWQMTRKAKHKQYLTFLLVLNKGLNVNHVFTYRTFVANHGFEERVVNYSASYFGAMLGYQYTLTKRKPENVTK
jgi:hypothetical protein